MYADIKTDGLINSARHDDRLYMVYTLKVFRCFKVETGYTYDTKKEEEGGEVFAYSLS